MKLTRSTLLPRPRSREAAFTMVEIAISLAVIGFALVAIIGVLPTGMNVQRENREETIVNQDATLFAEAIRDGARGLDDLTNYVMGITITTTDYNAQTTAAPARVVSYRNPANPPLFPLPNTSSTFELVNGQGIIGILGTPKYGPGPNNGFSSNYVVAYVRAMSGSAAAKFPQNNADVLADTFSYRLTCENMEIPVLDPNAAYDKQLRTNLHELRLLFRWPLQNNGTIGNGRLSFRTTVGSPLTNDPPMWFFQPRTFAKAGP